ncbi:hypothetical protein SCHPADRAFT_881283 [Schizopora paradoxa]|uniref:BTB domain-containing protein n=1 Tax=Schizopora paradoxa TaxID=27342 RepID=A0A0H2RSC0_9AGAM|nr:hypothetical protein SCHPADRAFT_881283 [Schizopora paradoxa]
MEIDTQGEGPSRSPKPHETLWFFDGNIVLVTDTYLFKVHKGLLALHSCVFRDMFDVPGADEANAEEGSAGKHQEMYEGIPSVKLVGDEGEDVAHLLRTIYEHRYYDPSNDETPVDTITALLTLSTKYDFKNIRKDVITHLSRHYPMTLKEYDLVSKDLSAQVFGEDIATRSIPLLKAAFSANVEFLLPALFFASSDINTKAIFRLDLTPECLRTLMCGRILLDNKLAKFISNLPEDLIKLQKIAKEEDWCRRTKLCLETSHYRQLSELIDVVFSHTSGEELMNHHLTNICMFCRPFVVKSIDEKRAKIWDEVPGCFGLSKWDVLRAQLKDAIQA